MKNKPPTHVYIPLPFDIQRITGVHSSFEKETFITVRASALDKELIVRAANECRVARSMFMRWVAISAARQILNHVDGNKANDPEHIRRLLTNE